MMLVGAGVLAVGAFASAWGLALYRVRARRRRRMLQVFTDERAVVDATHEGRVAWHTNGDA